MLANTLELKLIYFWKTDNVVYMNVVFANHRVKPDCITPHKRSNCSTLLSNTKQVELKRISFVKNANVVDCRLCK